MTGDTALRLAHFFDTGAETPKRFMPKEILIEYEVSNLKPFLWTLVSFVVLALAHRQPRRTRRSTKEEWNYTHPRLRPHLQLDQSIPRGIAFAGTHNFNVGKNRGGLRVWIVCSKLYAIFSSVGSLQARPKKLIPTGKPKTNPAGTVISG